MHITHLIAVCLMLTLAVAASAGRERILLDPGWRFHLGHAADPAKDFGYGMGAPWAKAGDASGPARPGFDDGAWRKVDLPHDWVVELPFDSNGDDSDKNHGFKPIGREHPENSIGWYRRTFDIPNADLGQRLSVEFDGVFRDCMVWLNGQYIGRNLSGYSPFRFDVTDAINYGGSNVLVVRANATEYEGWFYEGGGIYRHVWLVKTDPVHVAHWGTYVTSVVKRKSAEVTIRTEVMNESDKPASVAVWSQVAGPDGAAAGGAKSPATKIAPWGQAEVVQKVTMPNAKLWSLETPNLYTVNTTVGTDTYQTTFGIRTIRFDPDKGFFLNGKHVVIKGTCNHQDHAGVGSALPDRIQYCRIEKLKEMGCNAYRTSHNAPTAELLDACDKLGMLVMDEQRLIGGTPEVLDQLERMVRRDRNHPSIILWSLGNEEPLQSNVLGGRAAKSMQRVVKQLDPTRPTTFAGSNGSDYFGINEVVDVRGWNYTRMGNTDQYHKDHPKQPIVGSEEASTLCTRGEYKVDRERGYLSAYDTYQPGWGKLAEEWWTYFAARPYLAGAFVWTGFDYRGEPTPYSWPCISSHFGIIDICGFPKDNFYYYQAWWTDKPVLHLLPHWNWPGKEGQEIDVWCHSNCEKVDLLLNAKSLGTKEMPRNSHLEWKVPYAPGSLEAKGYTGGKLVATDKRETTGPPAKLLLSPDRKTIAAEGMDVSMVTVSVLDAQGRVVPVADNLVRFEVSPNARIIGVGNGDPSSHEADKYFSETLSRNIGGWKMKLVDGTANRPEVAPEFDDSSWQDISVTSHRDGPLRPGEAAVYRVAFDIPAGEHWQTLSIGRIDDLGWVYLNGKKLGETKDWERAYSFDVSSALQSGKNVLAIVVKNTDGPGGVSMGATLSAETTPQWKRRAFNGLCMVIVQSSTKAGAITLKAESAGLEGATAAISVRRHAP